VAKLRRDNPDPRAARTGIVEALAADTAVPGFRGRPYANLAAEFCDRDHPGRTIAAAEQLVMLRAGAMAVASVGSTDQVASAFADAWKALIDGR
jgi:hypothetical protein